VTAEPVTAKKASPVRAWLPWALLFVVVVTLLAFGSQGTTGDLTAQDRVTDLSRSIKCPTCSGESAAESNAPSSQEVRRDIAQRIEQGQTDDEIRAFYVSRYGEGILLTPASTGVASLVWIIPVVAFVIAVTALVLIFRRGRGEPVAEVSEADRALVEDARHAGGAPGPRGTAVDDPHGEGSSR
jgi:cytochrome c-type biogenesis protein CcmH